MENLDDFTKARVVYRLDSMDAKKVRKDIVYRTCDGIELKLDVYYPENYDGDTDGTSLLPAVIFAHGDAPAEMLQNAKDWGQYVSWGQLVAASGLIGITFNRRSTNGFTNLADSSSDVESLFRFIESHGDDLGVDKNKLGLWVCSAGGPACLSPVLSNRLDCLECIVSYYALMSLEHIDELRESIESAVLTKYSATHQLKQLEATIPPMLIVRAGLDSPVFNDSIDEFIISALNRNAALEVITHPTGQHAFDVLDDDDRSKQIINRTLQFFKEHLID